MKGSLLALTALITFFAFSCQQQPGNSVESADAPLQSLLQEDERQPEKIENSDRKIIRQGDIRFETRKITETRQFIEGIVKQLDGYLVKDNAYDYPDRMEQSLVVRVPANRFDTLLRLIAENVNKLDSKNIEALDVTEEYVDIASRIKTKKELQNTYREILKKATKVEEILNIEKEIGNLQTEIESVEGRMKYLKDRIMYSSLTLEFYQNKDSGFHFFSRFMKAFENGWEMFLGFIIGLANLWVFILILLGVIILSVRFRRKKHQGKIEKK